MVQYFKGDESELKMYNAGLPAFESVIQSLDQYYLNAYSASNFLLMLYDSGRMPFADRVPRETFVAFILQAIPNFPSTGTFESYIFILKSIFGDATEVLFEVPAPGKLNILVDAESSLFFNWIAREFIDGLYVESNLVTQSGDQLELTGVSGIESQAQLISLLTEIIPQGIFTDIDLQVFDIYDWITLDGLDTIVDKDGNKIVFFEIV